MASKKKPKTITFAQAVKKHGSKAAFFRAIGVPHQTGYDWGGDIPEAYQAAARKACR